ncbi:hypothetical protein VE01_06769 [Pseudogymnoascus verrucosus]|uniref:Uncharacterized protein n=1 Tax=Pseudogymnoascus verrucosus TaxID=342668 RepID=A0A1B8GJS4_9PEZI|nr:uncharacterized protein VE01_06769 [Pseudogymnoascus verrucosus]OBT96075.1 hypothetical protein VE01_06769 [Pseudogymnoascus verrucosus]
MPPGEQHLEAFGDMVTEFIKAFEVEDALVIDKGQPLFQSTIMRKCWETGSFWYFHAVNSPKAHILCRTLRYDAFRQGGIIILGRDVDAVIEEKLKEEDHYKEQLRIAFIADPGLMDSTRK